MVRNTIRQFVDLGWALLLGLSSPGGSRTGSIRDGPGIHPGLLLALLLALLLTLGLCLRRSLC